MYVYMQNNMSRLSTKPINQVFVTRLLCDVHGLLCTPREFVHDAIRLMHMFTLSKVIDG